MRLVSILARSCKILERHSGKFYKFAGLFYSFFSLPNFISFDLNQNPDPETEIHSPPPFLLKRSLFAFTALSFDACLLSNYEASNLEGVLNEFRGFKSILFVNFYAINF